MTRRRLLLGLLLASALLACFAGWLWVTSGARSMRARFEQVKEGMSREEVIRTVGVPPGDYSSSGGWTHLEHGSEQWSCDDGLLLVQFNDDGSATEVRVFKTRAPSPTLTERIRRWLGL
jgi:hypothetical protein